MLSPCPSCITLSDSEPGRFNWGPVIIIGVLGYLAISAARSDLRHGRRSRSRSRRSFGRARRSR